MFLALTVAFATGSAFAACSSNQIDVTGNGSNCQTAKFTLTTTSTTTSFQFSLSAAGTFYVDCGDGGTLSGTGASGKTITKTNLSGYTYTCSWNSAGAHTIRFGGAATGYGSGEWIHTIRFNINGNDSANENVKKIASISGSLGAIFGRLFLTMAYHNQNSIMHLLTRPILPAQSQKICLMVYMGRRSSVCSKVCSMVALV